MRQLKNYEVGLESDSLGLGANGELITDDFEEGIKVLQEILDHPVSSHQHGECLSDVTKRLINVTLKNNDEIRGAKSFLEWFIK